MSQSVLSRPKVVSHKGRSAADRSFEKNFNTSAGIITPVMMEPCIAGTKGVINRRVFTRSTDVVAPNFTKVQQHFDFFKIPIRLILSNWNDFKLNVNDVNSSRLLHSDTDGFPVLGLGTQVPNMNFGNLKLRIVNALTLLDANVTVDDKCRFLNDLTRLLPNLGYGSLDQLFNSSAVGNNLLSLIPLAAYQKAYYDHYRNTTYESNNPFAYNLDWLMYDTSLNRTLDLTNKIHAQHFKDMATLRYVNYRNDYYHNIYPSLNYSISQPSGTTWSLPANIVGIGDPNDYMNPVTASPVRLTQYTNTSASIRLSTQAIRAAFALDKLMRASAYAPKHVRDQFRARFGVDVGDKVSNESERLGSFVNDIVFGEVTSTSSTSQAQLGDLGAKGVGGKDFEKDIEFYCEEDSIILGVSYFIPRAMYDVATDEYNMKLVREDFYQPEFENLGLRPIYQKNINPDYGVNLNNIVGYTVPNQRYKLGRDLNTGLFTKNVYYYTNTSSVVFDHTVDGVLMPFTTRNASSRTPAYIYGGGVSIEYFKVYPQDLDSVFRVSYPNTYEQVFDQFYSNVRIKFAITHGMSVHGQPSL